VRDNHMGSDSVCATRQHTRSDMVSIENENFDSYCKIMGFLIIPEVRNTIGYVSTSTNSPPVQNNIYMFIRNMYPGCG
jgi:hypothetical protein